MGCSPKFIFGNQSYSTANEALAAAQSQARENIQIIGTQIEPLPNPIAKSAKIVFPNRRRLIDNFSKRNPGGNREVIGYNADLMELRSQQIVASIKHRNIFTEVSTIEVYDTTKENPGDADVMLGVYLSSNDHAVWVIQMKGENESRALGYDTSKKGIDQTKSFLQAIERAILKDGGAAKQ